MGTEIACLDKKGREVVHPWAIEVTLLDFKGVITPLSLIMNIMEIPELRTVIGEGGKEFKEERKGSSVGTEASEPILEVFWLALF